MQRYPFICLGSILCFVFAISEGFSERHLQTSSFRIPIQIQEDEKYRAFLLIMRITNRIYNQSLEDHNSDDYVKLSDEVKNLFYEIFGCSRCATADTFEGVTDIAFSNGSVIVESTLVFNTMMPINGDIVKNMFCNAIMTGSPNTSLIVNPTYTNNLPAPVTVPVPVMTTTPQPTTTSRPSTTTTTTPPQPTTTSLSVPTIHQSADSTTQYYSDISSSIRDSDLSKVTSPSHNIPDSTYTSTPEPITNTATPLLSHVTNGLSSSSTTTPENNSELTHITAPSSHVTNKPNNSAPTLSENTADSTDTETSPLSSHATNGIQTTTEESTTDFSKNTKSPPLIIASHTTRGSSKTDSNSSPPKATTSITKPVHWSTTSKSDSTSTLSETVNPHHNTTAISLHPSSHANTLPKVSTNATSTRKHGHINILSTTKPKNGSAVASSSYDRVPGWGIALLVLASVILLLLLIFFILALWHWCCHREETGLINVTGSPKPYDREPSAPEFLTMGPYRKIYPEELEKPKKNRTGMYVVNP